MGRVKNREFWESAKYNNLNFIEYYNRLFELAISMFEWKNLPDSVDSRFLEIILFSDGDALFFKDDVINESIITRCTIAGRLNIYNIPVERRAYANNGYQNHLTNENSVLIFNNLLHTNSIPIVENFAKRMWDIDRTIDVNIKAQKTPILLLCDEKDRLTMKNIYMQYSGNEPVIYGSKNLNTKNIQALTTNAPYVADKLYDLKVNYWNEALTYLGISNINFQKRERLISDEVARGQGGTIANRYSRLEARRQACKQINKMFGLNVWVDFREDYDSLIDDTRKEVVGEPNSIGIGGDVE